MQELNTTKFTDEELIKEILWENHQVDEGVRRYNEATDNKSLEDTDQGTRIIRSTVEALINNINESYIEAENSMIHLKGGTPTPWHFLIGLVDAKQAAIITLKKALEYVGNKDSKKRISTTTTLATMIAEALRQQLMFENWKQNSEIKAAIEGYKKSYASILIERAKGQVHRNTISNWKRKFAEYENIEWGTDGLVVGMKLIELLVAAAPETFTLENKMIKGKTNRIFALTNEAAEAIGNSKDQMSLNRPFLMPTLIEPLDWHFEKERVIGGYHHLKQPLFTAGLHKHTAADNQAASPEFLAAINAIQKTAWTIDTWMLSVIEMLYGTKSAFGDVPQLSTIPVLDKLSTEEYYALSDEDRKAYHKKRQVTLEANESIKGKHSAFSRKLSIAHKMADHDEFFFPYFADFRGRLYPMAQELNPQGDQTARALLKFKKGKKLGTSGLYWLKIHLANIFGKDKETFEEREAWVSSVLADGSLQESVDQPLDGGLWTTAEEPLTFLATAKELVEAYSMPNPADFMSHTPVAMDGVCNGMQLLSLLGKDELGAEKTNCRAIDKRFDLYSEVAAEVMSIIKSDRSESPVAEEWFQKLNNNKSLQRKTVKRAVMTTPYGVTTRGIQEQLINDRHCSDLESSRISASQYLTSCIQAAMSKVNGKAVGIMAWFQDIAEVLAEQNKIIQWDTPMGLKVTQSYFKHERKRVSTVLGDVILWVENQDMGMDIKKNKLAIAPNVIHSLDAAMLQLTVLKMAEEGNTDFAMIHDSYGMHASYIETLHSTLREAAYEIFSADILSELKTSIELQNNVVLADVPELGNYDLNEIKSAGYFFS
tara:strand:- start:734 stop:3208 length:2475 start_codon:yes stop_codon:yes gene_type:complete